MSSNRNIPKLFLFQLVAILIVLNSCRVPVEKEFTDLEKELIKNEVRDMMLDYNNAIINQGLTGEFAYLDTSSAFYWVPPGFSKSLSYAEVKVILEQNAATTHFSEITWDTLRIEPLTRTLATYTGILNTTIEDSSGNGNLSKLIESGVVIKRETGWKLLCGQTAVINP